MCRRSYTSRNVGYRRNAEIVLEGATAGARCVLFLRNGRLATLERYTFGG